MKKFYVTKKQCREYIEYNIQLFGGNKDLFENSLKSVIADVNEIDWEGDAQKKWFTKVYEVFNKEYKDN